MPVFSRDALDDALLDACRPSLYDDPAGLDPAPPPIQKQRPDDHERGRDFSFLGPRAPMPEAFRNLKAAVDLLDEIPIDEGLDLDPDLADLHTRAVLSVLWREAWKRAFAIERCGARTAIFTDDRDPSRTHLVRLRCRDRMCIYCQKLRAIEWQEHVARLARGSCQDGRQIRTMTLTQRDRAGESLQDAWTRFDRSLRLLRQTPEWKAHVWGWFRSTEVTFTDRRRWHVHAHLVLAGFYWEKNEIRKIFARIQKDPGAGFCSISLVRGLGTALDEAIKYPLKPHSLAKMSPHETVEFIRAARGRRLYSLGGAWARKWPQKKKLEKPFEKVRSKEEVIEAAWRGDRTAMEQLDSLAARQMSWEKEQLFKALYHPEMLDIPRPPPRWEQIELLLNRKET